jgi:polyisoprenoid-binding protein YceI
MKACTSTGYTISDSALEPTMRPALLKSGLIALVIVLTASGSARAQQTTFNLDPGKTVVSFTLGASFHTVHGTFQVKSGTIRFDPSTGAASGKVVVDATSGQTGNKKRDRTMHRDVLQSQRYPEITFTPTRLIGNVSPQGESRVQVEGVIRLQDNDHPVTLPFQVQASGDELRATTQFVVPYVAWGLTNPSNIFLHVADKLELSLVATGKLRTAAAQR